MTDSARIQRERDHGRFLAKSRPGEIWNWETAAGQMRKLRRVGMLTEMLLPGMNVLEVGCGTGLFTREFVKKGIDLTAIDISPELISLAQQEEMAFNCRFEIENVTSMSFPVNHFHAVIGSSVLHHLDLVPALREIFRVVKPGGWISFTEPNMLNPQIALQKNIPALKRAMGDSPDETAFFSWSIRKKLIRAGFADVEVIPFDFLHPSVPEKLIRLAGTFGNFAEKTPLLRQIAGSLHLKAHKHAV